MDDNQLNLVEKYETIKPFFHKIVAIIDNCYRDCHNKYYHTFEYKCEYDIKLKNITNMELIIITIFDENMVLFELKKTEQLIEKGFIYLIKKIN